MCIRTMHGGTTCVLDLDGNTRPGNENFHIPRSKASAASAHTVAWHRGRDPTGARSRGAPCVGLASARSRGNRERARAPLPRGDPAEPARRQCKATGGTPKLHSEHFWKL